MRELGRHAWAELADELSALVIRGELKPGQRLVEIDIANQFGVSRGPVRTALADLEKRGLVEATGRRGLVVAQMNAREVREVSSVRIALEVAAIAELATQPPSEALSTLAQHVDQLEDAAQRGDHAHATEADLAFHRGLCQATGNRQLLRAWDSLADQIRLAIGTLQSEEPEVVSPLYADHRLIFNALQDGTAEVAQSLLHDHLVNTREAMLTQISRQP